MPTRNMTALFGVLHRKTPGDTVRVRVLRDGKTQTVAAQLGTRGQREIEAGQVIVPKLIHRLRRYQWMRGSDTQRALNTIANEAARSSVEIFRDGKRIARGVIVNRDGLLLTKANPLEDGNDLTVRLPNGRSVKGSVMAVDRSYDLALVKVEATGLTAVQWADSNAADAQGRWVVSVGDRRSPVLTASIIGTGRFEVPSEPGTLGILIGDVQAGGVAIRQVFKDTAAEAIGLQSGDVITRVAGKKVENQVALVRAIQSHEVGETIAIEVLRGDDRMELYPKLARRVEGMGLSRNERMDHMTGKLSLRAAGFPVAFQHDGVIEPGDCGGAIVNLDGKVIGINIARAGRIETFALPADIVRQRIARMRGAQAQAELNRSE